MTGTSETTLAKLEYEWKKNKICKFVDFPGYGTYETIKDYIKDFLENDCCDFYIIAHNRLHVQDILLAKYIFQSMKKQFILARTHTDKNVEYEIGKALEQGQELTEQDALRKLKEANLKEFEKFSKHFDAQFTKKLCVSFLISSKKEKQFKFEMEDLLNEITERASPLLAENFSLNCFVVGKKQIRTKRNILENRIDKLSIASGITDILPFLGSAIDIVIIVAEVIHYRNYFGLTNENFEKVANILELDKEKQQVNMAKVLGLNAKYLNIKNLVLTTLSGLSIGFGAGITKIVFGSLSLGFGALTFG